MLTGLRFHSLNDLADVLCYLRDYCVPESFTSVHEIGNPIIHSNKWRLTRFPSVSGYISGITDSKFERISPLRRIQYVACFQAVALTVGNRKESFALVWGPETGSLYAIPSTVIPDSGQVCENSSEPQREMTGYILQQCVSGSYSANGVGEVGPEVSGVAISISESCDTEWLAGVSPCDDVDIRYVLPVDLRNVAEIRDVGPVLAQYTCGIRFVLALPSNLEPSPLKAEIEASNPREQAADCHRHTGLT
jgi:hypothetical protein